jgi:hypothetical protein
MIAAGGAWAARFGLICVAQADMKRVHRCLGLAAVLSLLAAGTATSGATAASGRQTQRLVVNPRGGEVIRSDLVRIAIRSSDEPVALNVRLNGVAIGRDFTPEDRGVRTLVASISHGLRRGSNVLHVTVRRAGAPARTQTVRFTVPARGLLVGAGLDRRVVVGDSTVLGGRVAPATTGQGVPVHWRLVSGPDRSHKRPAASPVAVLSDPGKVTARFRATAPGQYTLRLTAGSGRARRSDSVTLSVVPPNPLVAIDTMVGGETNPGVRVGDTTYTAPHPPPFPRIAELLQVVVLNRQTLGLVSNASFTDIASVKLAVERLTDADLVIVVLHRLADHDGPNPLTHGCGTCFSQVLAPIGFPLGFFVADGGLFSVIGVPGMKPADATINYRDTQGRQPSDAGEITGYLTPDRYLNYGFVSPQTIPFGYPKVVTCTSDDQKQGCGPGFRVTVRDPVSFQTIDTRLFATGRPDLSLVQQSAMADTMANYLNGIPTWDLVSIETVSDRAQAQLTYRPPVDEPDRASMVALAAAIARVGGTRNAFNAVALANGPADGAPVYSLVGWAGAGEGNGTEAALGVDGAGDRPDLSGVWRRDRSYQFRPAEASTTGAVSDTLQNLTLQPPTDAWPDSGPALDYLGATDERLGCDPRSAYWTGSLTESDSNAIAEKIAAAAYPGTGAPDPCTGTPVQFTAAQFQAAKGELLKELGWVGNVRSYLAKLASPFADGALQSWTQAQTIADQIYQDAKKPDDKTSLRWVQFTSTLTKLIGAASFNPISGGVAGIMGNLLDFGVWLAGAGKDGIPGGDDVRFQADELGARLVDQAQQAQATYARIGDIIVSDYDKLRVVGADGGCNPSSPACPKEYAYTEADKAAFSAAFYRAVQRTAYEKLLPLGYRVYQLKHFGRLAASDRGRPPDVPAWFHCGVVHPFYAFGALAYTSLLQELDPVNHINLYDVFVLAAPQGFFEDHGTPPPDGLLKRMFDPVSKTDDPNAGGLGISPAELMRTAKHYRWNAAQDPPDVYCYFG